MERRLGTEDYGSLSHQLLEEATAQVNTWLDEDQSSISTAAPAGSVQPPSRRA